MFLDQRGNQSCRVNVGDSQSGRSWLVLGLSSGNNRGNRNLDSLDTSVCDSVNLSGQRDCGQNDCASDSSA